MQITLQTFSLDFEKGRKFVNIVEFCSNMRLCSQTDLKSLRSNVLLWVKGILVNV